MDVEKEIKDIRENLKNKVSTQLISEFRKDLEAKFDEIKEFTIEYSKPYGRTVIMKLRGINSPEDAATLRGGQLMVPEEESPPLPDGVYYYYQIIGLKVFTVDGVYIGEVTDIIETGSNDVYVVRDGEKEYLIPVIRDVIREIDIRKRRIIISPEAGLLE